MQKEKYGKTFAAVFFAVSLLFSLASCGSFQEQDVIPPAGGELWTEKIRASYPDWQPPREMPPPVSFWEEEEPLLSALPPPPPRNTPSQKKPEYLSHKIAAGETLWGIAVRYYNGRGWLWKEIYDANRDRISSPDLLRSGCEILIPAERIKP